MMTAGVAALAARSSWTTVSAAYGQQRPPAPARREEYTVVWLQPRAIPADLESWLNTRMAGFALAAIDRDEKNGRYLGFFRPRTGEPWKYKVMLVPADGAERLLNDSSERRLELVAVSAEWQGPRGLQYLCFFRQR
jgi:hypothetical protein